MSDNFRGANDFTYNSEIVSKKVVRSQKSVFGKAVFLLLFVSCIVLLASPSVSAEKMWNFRNHTVNISHDLIVNGQLIGDGSGLTGVGGSWNISGSNLYPRDLGLNVGVGTSSPGAKLDIQSAGYGLPATSGSAQTYAGLRVSPPSGSGNVVLDFGTDGSTGTWLQTTLRTDLSQKYPLLLNPNGGNVGIGTTSPSDPLHVFHSVGVPGIGQGGGLMVERSGQTQIELAAGSSTYGGGLITNSDKIFLTTNNDLTNPQFVLDTAGNLGLGAATGTDTKLKISDGSQSLAILTNRALTGAWPPVAQATTMTLQSSGSSAGNIAFATGNTERMRIDQTGNVGIGDSTPDGSLKLDVAGQVGADAYCDELGNNCVDIANVGGNSYQADIAGVSNAGWTKVAFIQGLGLGANVELTLGGTANSVVVESTFDIVVQHSQDFYVESYSGGYTIVTLRLTSNGDDDFFIEAQTNSANAVTLDARIVARGGEVVTMNPAAAVSGSDVHTHTTKPLGKVITHDGGPTGGMDLEGDLFASGNVGIGTTAIDAGVKLKTSGGRIFAEGGTTAGVAIGTALGTNTAAHLSWDTAGLSMHTWGRSFGDQLFLDADAARVGVGTTTPDFKFQVEDATSGDATWTNGINIKNTGTTAGEAALSFNNVLTGSNHWIVGLNQDNDLNFNYGPNFQDGNNKMVIQEDGKVGIGAGIPTAHLETLGQDVAFYSGTTTQNLRVGRGATENIRMYVTDGGGMFIYDQDETDATAHDFTFNIDSPGTGSADWVFQNRGVESFRITEGGQLIGDGSGLTGVVAAGALSSAYLSGRALADANTADGEGITAYHLTSGAANSPAGVDHSLFTTSYSNAWSTQMAGDWRTNDWYVRNQNNGAWGAWKQVAVDGMTSDFTYGGNLEVTGDLKMTGTDSVIWTPNTASGFTGLWDTYNSKLALKYTNGGVLELMPASGNTVIGTTGSRTLLNSGELRIGGGGSTWDGDAIAGLNTGMAGSDGAIFRPVNDGSISDLRLYIPDDANDKFSIWGDTCGGGSCGTIDNAVKAFEVTGGGDTYVGGDLQVDGALNVAGGTYSEGAIRTFTNVADYYVGSTPTTGTVAVRIDNTPNVMLEAEIVIQGYNGLTKCHVRGYTYTGSTTWHQPAATCLGSGTDGKYTVRFGKVTADNDRVILIGTTTSNWGNYPHVSIPRVTYGYPGSGSSIGDWSISIVTDESIYSNLANVYENSGFYAHSATIDGGLAIGGGTGGPITFNAAATGDAGIRGNGENLEFFEPEDSNKVWAYFQDDTALHLTGTPNLVATGDGTFSGGDIKGAGTVNLDLGEASTLGALFTQTADNGYFDISCADSGGNDLCEFKTGIFNNGGTFYNQNALIQRGSISNDGGNLILNDAVDINGALTADAEIRIDESSPQIYLNDNDGGDDFFIHVNDNNFYILADRDDSGGWDGSYPMQLEADTNKGYLFGNEIATVGGGSVDGRYLRADTADTAEGLITFNNAGTTNSYINIDAETNYWKFLRLQTGGSAKWDIATKEDDLSGALQFRPAGSSTNRAYLSTGGTFTSNYLGRNSHSKGHLVGSYNSVGSNDGYTNPIYTIGSSYNPSDSALGNMYGIGYSHDNLWVDKLGVGYSDGWGMYVAADGDIRATISGSTGAAWFAGDVRSGGNLAVVGAISDSNDGTLVVNDLIQSSVSGNGYITMGAQNPSHAHFYTDRSNYYFNTELRVDTGIIGSYNEDLQLRRAGTNKFTATATDTNIYGGNVVITIG